MEDILLPRLHNREELKKEAEKLREAVLNGTVVDRILSNAIRKELNKGSSYDGEWNLKPDEYLEDVINYMDLSSGVNLINSSVGTGKTSYFIETIEDEKGENKSHAKKGYIVLVPLNSIRLQFNGDNDVFNTGICTWNQVDSILKYSDKEYFADKTLVIDEVHGFFLDYDYKAPVINRLLSAFVLFKSVIMLSGTATPDDFSGIEFNKVYKIYKPSEARKVISTVVSTGVLDLVLEQLNTSKRKTIVLLNQKSQCETLNLLCTRTGLEVNADKKKDKNVIDLFVSGQMNYEVLYGTYSMVEGLSITNELEEVDVIIVGDEHPGRIEQFTNRFRKISKLKSVTYYIPRKEVEEVGIFNRNAVVADAKLMKELLQATYEALQTDEMKHSFTSQYRRDIAGSYVYFYDGKFEVSYSNIDYQYAEHKQKEFSNDFKLFSAELKKYDFIVQPMRFEEGDKDNNKIITDAATMLKEAAVEADNAIIEEYLADALSGNVKPVEEATELYTAVDQSVEKLLSRGLHKDDFEPLVKGFIEDRSFFYRAHLDADYFPTGNTIREMIVNMVAGKTKLDAFAIRDIADAIIQKVLKEYFTGNTDLMLKHPLWSKCVTMGSTGLVSNSSKGAKAILERYITLGKGKQERVNGVKVRLCEVIHLSLTGLRFAPPKIPTRSSVEHVEARQSLEGIKAKLNQLQQLRK